MRRTGFSPVFLVLWLVVILLLTVAVDVGATRDIPDDNLAYPVLVTLDSNVSASGFYLKTDRHAYFVTARHVLIDETKNTPACGGATLLSYPRDSADRERNVLRLDLQLLSENGQIRYHAQGDAALVRIALVVTSGSRDTLKFIDGVSVVERAPSGILAVEASAVKGFDQVMISNEVFIFGYPTSLGIKAIPQIDYRMPLLRKGIIAGKNESQKTIILDCPIYPGNSGGPVLEVDQVSAFKQTFRVIGMVIQFVPFAETWVSRPHGYSNLTLSNSGYSVAVPMDVILDILWDE